MKKFPNLHPAIVLYLLNILTNVPVFVVRQPRFQGERSAGARENDEMQIGYLVIGSLPLRPGTGC